MAHLTGRFLWYELMTTDMEAATTYYADVVGWAVQSVAPGTPYNLFTAAGVPVSGVSILRPEAVAAGFKPGWLGYVGVDDVDASAGQLERLGGAVHVSP